MRAITLVAAALLLGTAARAGADPGDQFGQMGQEICKGPHLRLSPERPPAAADQQRARNILASLRTALEPYRDSQRAVAAGYVPFLPDVPQDVYHFSNHAFTAEEYFGRGAIGKPGSLLYKKRRGKFELVGAMYLAPERATDADLDGRIPLSVTHWHAHVNICLPKGITLVDLVRGDFGAESAQLAGRLPEGGVNAALHRKLNRRYGFMADGRFGFAGSIAEQPICEAVGGNFIPQAWGWMAHVYPFAGDDIAVAFGPRIP